MPSRTESPLARVDLARTIGFSFDGAELEGHPGDTLASALIANGVSAVARSRYLDRPRGVLSAGVEEPNALVELDLGSHLQPSVPATSVELYEGLRARSLAGRGRLGDAPDPSRYDKTNAHCDVLVVGGGVTGLAAAGAAAAAGARVIMLDEQPYLGGRLLDEDVQLEGRSGSEWAEETVARLADAGDIVVLPRTTALGIYDHGYVIAAERRTEHLPPAARPRQARQRLWRIRAREIVLTTGAIERPIVFADNDLPGVMLAGAAQAYANRYAVRPGRRAVVFTANDSAYRAAADLVARGVEMAALIDARPAPPEHLVAPLREAGVEVLAGAAVVAAHGQAALEGVRVRLLDERGRQAGPPTEIRCDLLAVSGGWVPTLQLFSQAGGVLGYDAALCAHLPVESPPGVRAAGAAAGTFSTEDCLVAGAAAGAAAAAGEPAAAASARPVVAAQSPVRPLWCVPPEEGGDWESHFLDLQRDVVVADVERAIAAGLESPEHVKRYTSLGTGSDQGKSSGLNALGVIADRLGLPIENLQPTTTRPPYRSVPFALFAGRARGRWFAPTRVTPIHQRHLAAGAVFEDAGQWRRAWYYPLPGESMDDAVERECRAVRRAVGIADVSTLGKIDVQGADAGEFLDLVYTNSMSTVKERTCRYGLLCRADGTVLDDGVVMRLADDHYVTTTTTGNAETVLAWLQEWHQVERPELDVRLTMVTDHWGAVAVAGPRSAEVLRKLLSSAAADLAAAPFMSLHDAVVAGIPARLCRVSFSGELAFEVHVSARHAAALWDALLAAGEEHGLIPYGTEAMGVLRAEKGFILVGQDTDSTVTPQDLGMDWIVSKKKEFVGRRSQLRPAQSRPGRRQLVGLLASDPELLIPAGAQLVERDESGAERTAGHITSSYRSGTLGRTFSLGLLKGGRDRIGETVLARFAGETATAEVTDSVFYDREGKRRDGN
jgi:sarcosine oxidase subunit alpha